MKLLAISAALVLTTPERRSRGPRSSTPIGDVVGVDDLILLVASERAKKRGVEIEVTSFKNEEIATQAVVNGQADIGQGTPYAAIEKVNVPVRFIVQLWSLQFFPVVNNEFYKSWKDLDGQEIAVQGRGTGTEAIMLLMAKTHGIKYKNVSYVPGSNVRALALIKGNIRASILDATNKNFLMREAPGKFIHPAARPGEGERRGAVRAPGLAAEERAGGLGVPRGAGAREPRDQQGPDSVVAARKDLGLLKDLPAKLEGDILPYFKDGEPTASSRTTAAARPPRRTTSSSTRSRARSRRSRSRTTGTSRPESCVVQAEVEL